MNLEKLSSSGEQLEETPGVSRNICDENDRSWALLCIASEIANIKKAKERKEV